MDKASYPRAIIALASAAIIVVATTVVGCDTNSGNAPAPTATSVPSPIVLTQAAHVITATPTLDANDPCAKQRQKLTDQGFMGGTEDSSYVHISLASCYEEANDHERAISEYKEAIRTGSGISVGDDYLNLGELYERLGRYDEALAIYLTLAQLKPTGINNNAELEKMQTDFNQRMGYSGAGDIYVKKSLYREAVDAYSKAITIDPSSLSDFERRGDVYVALGEKDKAAADYIYVLESDGKPFKTSTGSTESTSLGPEGREHLKQKLQALGVAVPDVTPYPVPGGGMSHITGSGNYPTSTPVPPLPTATPLH